MIDDPPRWPHQRFRQRVLAGPSPASPRLRALLERAARLRSALEGALVADEPTAPRILVVEDDPATRGALRALFARRGWEVSVAGTVAEGLALLVPPPDYLLLDLMLPDGDGEEILVAAREAGLPTRVVVATGVEDDQRLDAVARLGPDSLLRKPLTLEELGRACRGRPEP